MDDTVLLMLNNKSIITRNDWLREKEKNNQLYQPLENLLELLIKREIIKEYVIAHGLNATIQYTKQRDDLGKKEEEILNNRFFTDHVVRDNIPTVSNEELESYYQENKFLYEPDAVSSKNIVVMGIQFYTKGNAHKFLLQLKKDAGDFKQIARQLGITEPVQEFTVREGKIMMNDILRDKILAVKTFPTIQLIEIKKSWWVVDLKLVPHADGAENELIKDEMKKNILEEKRWAAGNEKIEQLKKQYNILVAPDFFADDSFLESSYESIDEALITLHGKPVITVADFLRARKTLFGSNFEPEKVSNQDPARWNRACMSGLIDQAIVDEYIRVHRLDQTAEYKAAREDLYRSIEYQLNEKVFNDQLSVDVSDEQVKQWIESNWITSISDYGGAGGKENNYISYDSLQDNHKESVKESLKEKARSKLAAQKIQALKKEYNVEINKNFFTTHE